MDFFLSIAFELPFRWLGPPLASFLVPVCHPPPHSIAHPPSPPLRERSAFGFPRPPSHPESGLGFSLSRRVFRKRRTRGTSSALTQLDELRGSLCLRVAVTVRRRGDCLVLVREAGKGVARSAGLTGTGLVPLSFPSRHSRRRPGSRRACSEERGRRITLLLPVDSRALVSPQGPDVKGRSHVRIASRCGVSSRCGLAPFCLWAESDRSFAEPREWKRSVSCVRATSRDLFLRGARTCLPS